MSLVDTTVFMTLHPFRVVSTGLQTSTASLAGKRRPRQACAASQLFLRAQPRAERIG
jgi:hypothetical protein